MKKTYKSPWKNQKQHKMGEMNQTEKRYSEILDRALKAGEISRWVFEKIKFKLAPNTFYTPDFLVTFDDHLEIHEIKGGFMMDDAIVKFKAAADRFPEFRWKLIQWKNKKEGWKLLRDI